MHLLIIVLWMGANSLFIHHHIINGVEISHSHPYAGDATNHCHSLDALVVINRAGNSEMLCGEELALCDLSVAIELYDYAELYCEISDLSIATISPRGPPSLA
jgi:hypothetical protein